MKNKVKVNLSAFSEMSNIPLTPEGAWKRTPAWALYVPIGTLLTNSVFRLENLFKTVQSAEDQLFSRVSVFFGSIVSLFNDFDIGESGE